MKLQLKLCLLLSISALLLSCGNDNSTGVDPDPDPTPDPGPAPNVVSKEIGPDGGEITSADGLLTLTFPAGALGNTETITIAPLDADSLGAEFEQLVATEGIGEAYELGPDGLEFNQPITVNFDGIQIPPQNSDTLGIDSGFLFTASDGALELLDSLQTMVDFNEGTVTVQGQLSHFSPLATSQANNGVSFFVFGVPDMLEVDGSFTADAQIFSSMTGTLADIVTVPGPAMYEDRSGLPIVSTTNPPSGELPGNSTDGFTGAFDYTCNDLGLGIYQSDLSVQVIFNLDSGEIPAESFVNFLTTVDCVEEMPVTFDLQIAREGDGSGSVSSNPAGIDCPDDCDETYNEGTEVTLIATPNEGSVFAMWSGDIAGNAPQDSVITLTMDQARNVTATFAEQQVQTFTLTVQKDGDGTGTVTSNPSGIDFGSDNTEDYPEGTMVTLTATPSQGSVFVMWSGDIAGNAPQDSVITLTMNQARTVTATFGVEQPTGTTGAFDSGTSFPQKINFIPNPSGLLNFNTDCSFLMVIAGSDLAFIDPCNGEILIVLDITFEMSSTGLNGLIPLSPVQDANGETRNWLLLTTQNGWFIMEIIRDNNGIPQMGEIRGTNNGFIFSAAGTGGQDGKTGGTNNAVITSDFAGGQVLEESSDMSVDGSYDGIGKVLLDLVSGSLPGTPIAAYRQSNDNGTPGDIIAITRGDDTNGFIDRVITSSYEIANGQYAVATIVGEAGQDVKDLECIENTKANPAPKEAKTMCFTANLGSDGISVILKMEDGEVQVMPEVNPLGLPIAIDAQITPSGNVQILVGSFSNTVYVAEYDFCGNLVDEAFITLPAGVDGLTDVRFDPQNPRTGVASFQNSDKFVIFEF